MPKPTAASAELERLDPFVGVWHTDGQLKINPSDQPSRFTAIDTYEWLPGGHFLLHRFDADMPDGEVQGIEVIGYARETDSYFMHSFDSTGDASSMRARVQNQTWTFTGKNVRFTGGFRDNGKVFAGMWELRSGDGAPWQPWMDVTLKKVE
jgi:hypothetical protein